MKVLTINFTQNELFHMLVSNDLLNENHIMGCEIDLR